MHKRIFEGGKKDKLSEEAMQACIVTGINPEELIDRPKEYFNEEGKPEDICHMKYHHYHQRRKNKLSMIALQLKEGLDK